MIHNEDIVIKCLVTYCCDTHYYSYVTYQWYISILESMAIKSGRHVQGQILEKKSYVHWLAGDLNNGKDNGDVAKVPKSWDFSRNWSETVMIPPENNAIERKAHGVMAIYWVFCVLWNKLQYFSNESQVPPATWIDHWHVTDDCGAINKLQLH